ncbi:MAG: response regulator transcription factor [Armatimonadetes bacterium]|nr:response regulator transcription factor [Armatimonadota bacterium]
MSAERKKILVVDANPEDINGTTALLEAEGYVVRGVTSGSQALQVFDELLPDMVILDIGLPGMPDGLEVCRQIRARSEVPIMIVTAKNEEVDVVVGLELGADEYVAKPYRPREFVARVRALLRRAVITERTSAQKKHLSFPKLEIDLPTRTVEVEGQEVHLTPKEFDLLFKLASNPRRVFTREELVEQVWGYTTREGDLRTVDTHVKRLRKKIQEGRDVPWALATVWGVGYRFDIGR